MKKIIAAVVLVIVSIVIGITAFANASPSESYTLEQENTIAIMAKKDNVSVEETKKMLVSAQKACTTGRTVESNTELTIEQHALCIQLAELNLIDTK